MNPIDRFWREFAYNTWANREILRALEAAGSAAPTRADVPPRAVEIMAHLVGAEWAWLRRLGPAAPDMPVWPSLTLDECGAQLRTLAATWKRYLDAMTQQELGRELTYTNFKGERWTSRVGDILTHVFTHACYHRGQIASLLGRAGLPAPYTDYIECVRRGYVDDPWGE